MSSRKSIFFWGSRALVLFTLGALAGPLGDLCHVLSKTDGYPVSHGSYRIFGLLPIWVPVLFGCAGVGIGISHLKWGNRTKPAGFREASIGIIAFLLLYAASGFLPAHLGSTKDLFMAAAAGAMWGKLDGSLKGAALGLGIAANGAGIEILLVHFGVFYYLPDSSQFHGIPTWLPWLYFAASAAVGNAARTLGKTQRLSS